jgi:hypothetical protein
VGAAVQLSGSILILAAFVLAQLGRLDPSAWAYLWLNVVGSGVLAVDAWFERQWGFLLLEGVWCLVSAASIVGKLRGRGAAPPAH